MESEKSKEATNNVKPEKNEEMLELDDMMSEQPRARTTIFIPKQNHNYFSEDFMVSFFIDGSELVETLDTDINATMSSTTGADRKTSRISGIQTIITHESVYLG